jgi:hypothetical protein
MLPPESFYAALAEGVYNRAAADVPLSLPELNNLFNQGLRPADFLSLAALGPLGLVGDIAANNGMVYSASNPVDGFAAQVLQNAAGQFIVVFRGTDVVSATVNDGGDLSADHSLASGTPLASQSVDMQKLMTAVLEKANGVAANVTVVGQSLGGGLASLAAAEYGVQGHVFDPAPFAAQLWPDAIAATMQLTAGMSGGSMQAQLDAIGLATEPPLQDGMQPPPLSYSLYSGTLASISSFLNTYAGLISLADIDTFLARLGATYRGYVTNVGSDITATRIHGEALSNHDTGLGWLIGLNSTQFDSENLGTPLGESILNPLVISEYDLGLTNISTSESIALHHPALIALLTQHPDFQTETSNDSALRDAFFDRPDIVGPNSGVRADPITIPITINNVDVPIPISSRMPGNFADPSIIYREMILSSDFYTAFTQKFGGEIASGTAGDGLSATSFDPNALHTGLVDLGLEVIRDHRGIENTDGTFTPNPTAMNVFGNISVQGYAEIHMSDITGQDFGSGVVNASFGASVIAATGSAYTTVPGIFTDPNVAPDLSWKVLVVQSGSDSAVMTYAPQGADINLSHMIVGGVNGNTITASKAGDFILGGAGDDTFILGSGASGGDGIGSAIIGNGGYDTVDYSHSNQAVDAVINATINGSADFRVSTDADGVRKDYLNGISYIKGPSLPDDEAHQNIFDFTNAPAGSDDELTLNGGYNDITASANAFLDINGVNGGDNTLHLSQAFNTYSFSGNASDVVINNLTTNVTYETTDVTNFDFSDMFFTAQQLFGGHPNLYYNLQSGLDPIVYYFNYLGNNQATYNYHDELLSVSHPTFSGMLAFNETWGLAYPTQAFTFSLQPLDPNKRVGTLTQSDTYDLIYTVDPSLLAAAPKNQIIVDQWTITMYNADGTSYSADFSPRIQGLGNTTTIAASSAFMLSPIPADENAGNELTASATMAFTDTDLLDHHTASVLYTAGTQIGALVATTIQDSTNSGSGTINLTFNIDDATWQSLQQNTVVDETFQVKRKRCCLPTFR